MSANDLRKMNHLVPWPWNADGVTSAMVLADHLDRRRMDELASDEVGDADPGRWMLEPMPSRPALADFFRLRRFGKASLHCVISAANALRAGCDEELVLACLIHDVGFGLIRQDHGWWGAQLVEPYVSERVSWVIRHHQALRFYPDPSVGYEVPETYSRFFGEQFQPEPYIEAAYQRARNHRWYMDARVLTLHDDYSFNLGVSHSLDQFDDIIGRHFKQPPEGLGWDNTASSHMWRTIINPNRAL